MEGTGSASGAWNNLVASATKSATEAVAGVLVKQAQADLSTAMGFGSAPADTAVTVDPPTPGSGIASQGPPRASAASGVPTVDVANPFASPLTGTDSGVTVPSGMRSHVGGVPQSRGLSLAGSGLASGSCARL